MNLNAVMLTLSLSCICQGFIEGAARHEGGAGEAAGDQPEAFSGKRAADVQTETQRLVSNHPPARHAARDHAQLTVIM